MPLQKVTSPCVEVLYINTHAGFPPELILSISDFLPVLDLNCLSMCNHRLLQISLKQISRLPSLTQDDKLLLLDRLERDLPGYFACDFVTSFISVMDLIYLDSVGYLARKFATFRASKKAGGIGYGYPTGPILIRTMPGKVSLFWS
jgi:hypothetical protein